MTLPTNLNPSPGREPRRGSLWARLREWVRPPVFPENDDLTRRASMLNALLLAAMLFGILFSATLPISSANLVPTLSISGVVIAAAILGLLTLRRGNVTGTAYLFIIFGWLLVAATSALFGGVTSPVFAGFALIIFVAGFLIGLQTAAVIAGVSIFFGGVLLFLANSDVLPEIQVSSLNYLIRFSFVFVVTTFLIYLTNRSFLVALGNVEKTKDALDRRTIDLTQENETLRLNFEESRRQLENSNRFLKAASEIARDTSSITNLQDMLDLAADKIATTLGFYHVGIFLTDENNQWAVLKAASSEGGRQMVAREHRLGVGKQGIVGFVTGIGQPRITQNIDLDRIHSVTPELPDTKSEMALPLKVRNEIIGALDIQGSVPDAFSDEDVSALQILADQIALSAESFMLADKAKADEEEVERVYGEYSQRAWAETHRLKSLAAYRLTDGDLIPLSDPQVSMDKQNKVEIPIMVRGNKIGSIEIAKADPGADWSEDETQLLDTLSEQLGIALESARLYNESQLRATTEKIIGDINADIWESLDMNSILRTTVEKLQNTLELPEVSIKLAPPSGSQPKSGNGAPVETE